MFISVLLAFIGEIIRTRQKPGLPRTVAFGISAAAPVLLLGFLSTLSGFWPADVLPSVQKVWMGLSLGMPFLAGLVIVLALRAWFRNDWGLVARIHYSLVAVAGIAFVWFLDAWNLLGFHL